MQNPQVETVATVTLGEGPTITGIHLKNETKCEGLSQEKFAEVMQAAKEKCPISKALASVESITLEAKLV
jgi:lipoyl-dependent peroxiredoxin